MLKARTKLACKIAGVDPARFNEMVHFGKYPCAPETNPGSARVFTEDDIIALSIFAELTELTISAEKAGWMACQVLGCIREKPEVTHVSFMRGKSYGTFLPFCIDPTKRYGGLPAPMSWMTFDIAARRAHVIELLEEEASILGSE